MHASIVCVGKLKEKFYRDAVEEYIKRLKGYLPTAIIEVNDEKEPARLDVKSLKKINEKEGERILSKIHKDDYVLALCIDGEQKSSEEFSQDMLYLRNNSVNHIVFIIGGSLGLSEEVIKRADKKISFSKMTFPHQLVRVILVEQIYRTQKIISGERYHK